MKFKKYLLIGIWIFVFNLTLEIGHWSFAHAQAIAPDPTRLSMGARILGMGKAFVGLSDDLDAIYTNPAGLGNVSNWQITSMSGNFMEDYSYLNLAGAYPTNFGVFAAGFTSSSIAGGYATRVKEGSDPNDPVYEVDPTQPTINYFNNVGIISYGNKLQNLKLPFSLPVETLFGANAKLFLSGLSGDGITQGSASGQELDLGLLFKFNPWFSFGSTVQNVLPSSMGGKLTYGSGHSESYPAVWENGIAVNFKNLSGHDVKFLFDCDYYPTRKGYPIIYHTGFEWLPINMVSLRAGIDQDAAGDGAGTGFSSVSNLTMGMGLNLYNFRFDYAYHQFTGAAGMSNSFFSLSYAPAFSPAGAPTGGKEKDTVKEKPKSKWDVFLKKTATPEVKSIVPAAKGKAKIAPKTPAVKKPVTKQKGGSKNVKKKVRL